MRQKKTKATKNKYFNSDSETYKKLDDSKQELGRLLNR